MGRFHALVAVLLVSCAADVDPWPGRYRGVLETRAVSCSTGDELDVDPQTITTTVVRTSDGTVAIAGDCLFEFREETPSLAYVRPDTCDSATPDGTPLTVQIISGRMELRGERLVFEIATRNSTPTGCADTPSMFDGSRL
jgi:hypothetical protein